MMETDRIESPTFPVKCKGCGKIYDGASQKQCPNCGTTAIVSRIFWSRQDQEQELELIRQSKERIE